MTAEQTKKYTPPDYLELSLGGMVNDELKMALRERIGDEENQLKLAKIYANNMFSTLMENSSKIPSSNLIELDSDWQCLLPLIRKGHYAIGNEFIWGCALGQAVINLEEEANHPPELLESLQPLKEYIQVRNYALVSNEPGK